MKNKSYTIAADVEISEGTSGMIVTQGGLFGGTALYFDKGRPVFHYNFVDVAHYEVAAKDPLAPGKHTIRFEFAYGGGGIGKGGTGTLVVDNSQVARGRIERTIPIRVTLDESLDVGEDTGTPVRSAPIRSRPITNPAKRFSSPGLNSRRISPISSAFICFSANVLFHERNGARTCFGRLFRLGVN
jgi:hypothetical protein